MVEGLVPVAFALTLLGAGGSGIAGCLEGVSVQPAGALEDFGYPGLELRSAELSESAILLDPSQTVEGYEVRVLANPDCRTAYRVQWQYETSVSIGAEGPHLDLLDWKHHTSEWTDLEPDSSGRRLVPEITEEQASVFPASTRDELVAAVAEVGGNWWVDRLAGLVEIGDEPSYVGLSEIRLRVLVKLGEGSWEPIWTIRFRIAMGC